MTGPTTRELNDPLWNAVFKALTPFATDQTAAAMATTQIVADVRRSGLKMVPDVRYGRWRHEDAKAVPREGDLACLQGWAVTANPHDLMTVANRRWTADWFRAAADAYEDHVHGHEGTDMGEKELKHGN